jgi:hypothetical protein
MDFESLKERLALKAQTGLDDGFKNSLVKSSHRRSALLQIDANSSKASQEGLEDGY